MTTATMEKKTAAEYDRLPEGAPFQLIEGEFVMNPASNFFHQQLVTEIAAQLHSYVKRKKLGEVVVSPVDVYLSDTDVYQPDVVFIAKDRLESVLVDGRIKAAPDLVVEVLSPSTGYYDLSHKKTLYESSGVKEYWIVYPEEETVEVLENRGGAFHQIARVKRHGSVPSKLLEGFLLTLDDVF